MSSDVTERPAEGWVADASTFGARLALVRQHMGWGNVRTAATACGLPPESWRTWERDGVAPRHVVTVAKQIATRTGCNYHWLLIGPEGPSGTATTREPLVARVVATVGDVRPGQRAIHSGGSGRAVGRTRPVAGGRVRPVTPIAV